MDYTIYLSLIVIVTVVFLILRKKIFIIRVKGSSMEPTLFNDDYVLGYRTRVFNVSDIVVANIDYISESDSQITVIKRVDYIVDDSLVPRLFLTGDNKEFSIDSRDKDFGIVPIDQVLGKVIWYK